MNVKFKNITRYKVKLNKIRLFYNLKLRLALNKTLSRNIISDAKRNMKQFIRPDVRLCSAKAKH